MNHADATRRAYRSDWRIFTAWCAARGLEPLPATPETVARFLSAEAMAGAKASTIGRRAAAIGYAHRLAGYRDSPSEAKTVRTVMRKIRRVIGTAQTRKAPATIEIVRQMLGECPHTLAGYRDRALLALGFVGAFRRSELVALEVADLAHTQQGLCVTFWRGALELGITIPRSHPLRPVEAVEAWLAAAKINSGPVFRPVLKGSRLQSKPLTDRSVAAIVKRYAALVGLDPRQFAGNSLRARFLSWAAESDAPLLRTPIEMVAKQSHLLLNIRRKDTFATWEWSHDRR